MRWPLPGLRGPLFLLLGLVLGGPSDALAQACCSSTGSSQFGIVGRCQSTSFSVDLAHRVERGSFDADGRYLAFNDSEVSDLVLKVGGGSRLGTDNWQLYGSVPIRRQYRDLSGLTPSSTIGLGDVSMGLRWTVLHDVLSGIDREDRSTWSPFLDLYVGVVLPTGRSYDQSEEPSFSDVMGTGSTGLEVGARLTKFLTESTVLIADAFVGNRSDRDLETGAETVRFQPGTESGVTIEWLELWTPRWSFGGGVSARWSGAARQDGRLLADSGTRRIGLQGYVTRTLVPMRSEAIVSIGTDAWWDGGGRNIPFAGGGVSFGYRRYQF